MFLLVIGGDVYEGAAIRTACANVYDNLIDLDQNGSTDRRLWYIYRELKHRIVLINPVVEIPPTSNELSDEIVIYDDCYQNLWINFDTQLKVASLGVYWSSLSVKFNMALTNLQVMPTTTCQSKWILQHIEIENFKKICTYEEREELDKVISLIPIDVVFHISPSSMTTTTTTTLTLKQKHEEIHDETIDGSSRLSIDPLSIEQKFQLNDESK